MAEGKGEGNGETARVGGQLRTITILPCIYMFHSIYHCERASWTTVYSVFLRQYNDDNTNIAFTHATVG